MHPVTQAHFDFSLDAAAFKERLALQLKQHAVYDIAALDEDELELVHAAGTGLPPVLTEKDFE